MGKRDLQRTLDEFWKRAEPRGVTVMQDPCLSTEIKAEPSKGLDTMYTHGCTGQTRVSFTYEREDRRQGILTVCATGDMAYRFPRFQ